ncbi:MAG: hypothetical protein ILA17_06055 [Ruminococcus sp.]|nr:hypothetical protein [Ruminiclostridium sp.]MBP1537412.1 hypothetical protein [Ruminococcus sp.]
MIQNAIPIIIGWIIMSVLYGASVALIVRRWRQDISKYKRKIAELNALLEDEEAVHIPPPLEYPPCPPCEPNNGEEE